MAVNYPRVRDTSHEPSYYGAGYGLCMAVKLDLGSTTRVVSFSSRMGYGGSNYYGTNYEGPCTGTAAIMRGAIWLNKPTNSTYNSPDFISDNTIDIAAGGFLANNGPGSSGRSIKFNEFTWTFSNAICGKSEVWVGWIHDRYRNGNNTCVAFATTTSSGDNYSRVSYNQGMTSTSLRFGFTAFNATEPYKTPTITISDNNVLISRYDVNRTIKIGKNTSGEDTATTVKVTVNNNTETTSIGNGESNYTFKPLEKSVYDGTLYTASATRIHNGNTSLSASAGPINLYTYRTPKIQNVSVSPASFSGIGNATLSWYTNGRRWTSNNEADFKTYYQFDGKPWLETGYNDPNTGDTNNALDNGSMALSESIITSNFTKDERSQEKITTILYVKRKNETSGVEAKASSNNITIQFWPKYEVNTVRYKNASTGATIEAGTDQYTDTTPKITVSWNYSTNADRGMISGYIIRVYRNNKTTQVGSDHIIPTTELSGSTDLDIKDDLYRGELNYIKIIPYYTLPNNSSKKEGPSTLYTFVTPIGRIHKPIISFPTHNSNWHNKQFRILLKAPEDDDMDVLGLSDAEYEYNNIELIITGKDSENKAYELKYTLNDNNNIFSNQIIHHKYNIVINPSIITAFPELLYYDIKIRFQKKYYKNIWSEYSDNIHLGISKIKELDLQKEQIIYINHYSTIRKYSTQLWEVYFNKNIEAINSDNVERKQHDVIYARDYQGIYNTILNIQSRVNNYTTFDSNRDNIKFNQNITNLSDNNKTKQELITAAKISNDPIGRNYKNILVECMNKLY